MMKRLLLLVLMLGLTAVRCAQADETTRAVQERLKAGGFYFGKVNGRYDSTTAAAITRYQIRNGLQITGKLDAPTRHALGVAGEEPEMPLRGFGEDAWRHLRKSDQEYLDRLAEEDAKVPEPSQSPATSTTKKSSAPPSQPKTARLSESRQASTSPGDSRPNRSANVNRERVRDYVAAFILAGLDPQVGAEAAFFADRVNYFGEPHVAREKIRQDLQRYDKRWPKRGFRLAGELEITSTNDKLKVSFPLRYELQNGSKRSTGTVLKTLVLEKKSSDDFQIVSVDERKAR